MSKNAKLKWFCKCKSNNIKKSPTSKSEKKFSEENFLNLTDSVNFMSDKFDTFGEQLKELLSEMKLMREENQVLKEQNKKFNNEFTILGNRINILEQKALENLIEVMGISEIQDEICTDTANLILNKLGFEKLTSKVFRVSSKVVKGPRKLVVKLSTGQNSDNIVSSSRKQKPRGNTIHDKWGNEASYIHIILNYV